MRPAPHLASSIDTRVKQTGLLVFFGFCICWVSATIARYVYPPPKRWELNRRQE